MSTTENDAERARSLYISSLAPTASAADWVAARKAARKQISGALRASNRLRDITGALGESGTHMLVFRTLMAPPVSQDQFKLICSGWSKASEKTGAKLRLEVATEVAAAFHGWRDRLLTRWLNTGRAPTWLELRRVFVSIEPLLASQQVSTARRNRLSAEQEKAVTDLLDGLGWSRVSCGLIKDLTTLKPRQYVHKTRFATLTLPQEVDIACGMRGTVVLAMECKVTNDETNSVKRVNDILKKATAWQHHWGSFVKTAALLQGVIKPADVDRLVAADVHVFWSHDLASFKAWLAENA